MKSTVFNLLSVDYLNDGLEFRLVGHNFK